MELNSGADSLAKQAVKANSLPENVAKRVGHNSLRAQAIQTMVADIHTQRFATSGFTDAQLRNTVGLEEEAAHGDESCLAPLADLS